MLLHQNKVPECLLFKSGKDTFHEIIYSALSLVLDLAYIHFTSRISRIQSAMKRQVVKF